MITPSYRRRHRSRPAREGYSPRSLRVEPLEKRIVLSADPVVWMISSSRVGGRRGDVPVDEMAVAGGIKGRAMQVVRSETNDDYTGYGQTSRP